MTTKTVGRENPAQAQRQALCDVLAEAGPDAPTLCEGWTCYDLAAHLVVREGRPDSAPGLVVRGLAQWTEKVRLEARQRPYEQLVEQVRTGPPRMAIQRIPRVDGLINTIEYFIHTEDVRRAKQGWQPRPLTPELAELLWKRLRSSARVLVRKAPVGVTLALPDGHGVIVARSRRPLVTVTGDAGELWMFCFNRKDAARVELAGDAEAVAALRAAKLGFG